MNLILVDRAAQFATVTMNRPEARNALGRALVADFDRRCPISRPIRRCAL